MAGTLAFQPGCGIFGGPAFESFRTSNGVSSADEEHTSETESNHSGPAGASAALLPDAAIFGPSSPVPVYTPPGLAPLLASHKLPDFAVPMQPKLLKQINNFQSKEELLAFVGSCLSLLDPINLVTCVYRLAKMHSNIRQPEHRHTWKTELCYSSTFQLLLRTIQSQMLVAQLLMAQQHLRGLDSRCVSNLIWAIVKLELASEPGCMGTELVLSISPLVIRLLPQSSPQGLANLLWAYAKMPAPPMEVMVVIMSQMADMLATDNSGAMFDAQALSNSVWALAHTRSKASDLDHLAGRSGCVVHFMAAVAQSANRMLRVLHNRLDLSHLQAWLKEVEGRFSCQALVNIVWSFASMLGEECCSQPSIKQMFVNAKREAILRLRATYSALQTQQAWVYHVPGGFNEQALSNIVYAYEKAGLLDKELLHWVFSVAALRLDRRDAPPSFKPQELCTLLRAAHLPIAEPFNFLAKLVQVLQTMPWIVRNWSPAEVNELNRALGLLETITLPPLPVNPVASLPMLPPAQLPPMLPMASPLQYGALDLLAAEHLLQQLAVQTNTQNQAYNTNQAIAALQALALQSNNRTNPRQYDWL